MPLFPATPKLGPVFTNVTHMIPLEFPVLIVIPAIIMDLILNRFGEKNKWLLAAVLGTAYTVAMLVVHWPLGNFMILPAASNWIFGTNYFSYGGVADGLPLSVRIRRSRRHLRASLSWHCNLARHRHRLVAHRAGWWRRAAPPSTVNVPQN